EDEPSQRAGTEMFHFIGKDILYFHALFWPAMLKFSGHRTPTQLSINGFLTVNGEKMSKSRGTFITARSYLDQSLNPEWLRYYYAAKSTPTMEDIDLNLEDFVARVNSDLVGKYVNIASRAAGFIVKQFGKKLSPVPVFDPKAVSDEQSAVQNGKDTRLLPNTLQVQANKYAVQIRNLYNDREFSKAAREAMELASIINQYFDDWRPWELARRNDEQSLKQLHSVCSVTLELFRILTLCLRPILPSLAAKAEGLLNIREQGWADLGVRLPANHEIKPYEHLMTRIDRKQITALVEANKETLAPPSPSGRGAGGEGKAPKKAPLPEDLLSFARKLRQEQTDAEQLLWTLLRDRRLGKAKFRRQHPVEIGGQRYVLDFYSHELKLAIELDGGQHQDSAPRDEARTKALATLGIQVLRFWNNEVLQQTTSVLEAIWSAIMEKSPSPQAPSPPTPLPKGEGGSTGADAQITIDDFNKLDLRVARIVAAEHVEGADKLLKITLDLGNGTRTVFAGIKSAYDPATLKDRLTVVVANLAPRKMKFGISEGMVLAASGEGPGIFLLSPDSGAEPGMRVK
ncbi:MAG TPA: methionine--tRNA ligase subunit beta, partial [Burkholderiales bacterium]|nr:methionine--tRNA ligase subunit beta [Burkholderiales bacterium]